MTFANGLGLLFLGMSLTIIVPLILNYFFIRYKKREKEIEDEKNNSHF